MSELYLNYISAVLAESTASPKGDFAPFETVVVKQETGAFCAHVVNSQGQVLYDGHHRWSTPELAKAEADWMRARFLLKFKRGGEEPAP